MSVGDTFALNEQPAGGRVLIHPLGGDGIVAPKSMYEVQATLAGDVTGSNNVITVDADPRFQSICTLMNGRVIGAASGIEMLFTMRNETGAGPIAHGFANAVPISTIAGSSIAVWNPPPVMTMNRWALTTANTDGDTAAFTAWFYNFDVRILELSPMWRILANLPRPGVMDSFTVA